jgi:RimJ/RimL family protein N-acetyltransferase
MELHEIWPIFGLRIRTPRIELRAVDPDLAVAVANLAAAGIHDPATMPFLEAWTDTPSPELEQNTLRHFWEMWAGVRPERWRISFAVLVDGEVQGIQAVHTVDYPGLRSFETGSWLGLRFQGRGTGREMRAAVLHLMFDALDAVEATTGAFADNAASLAVTRALGYEPNGTMTRLRRGVPSEELLFRMPREVWLPHRRDDIEVEGLSPACLAFLGL